MTSNVCEGGVLPKGFGREGSLLCIMNRTRNRRFAGGKTVFGRACLAGPIDHDNPREYKI